MQIVVYLQFMIKTIKNVIALIKIKFIQNPLNYAKIQTSLFKIRIAVSVYIMIYQVNYVYPAIVMTIKVDAQLAKEDPQGIV